MNRLNNIDQSTLLVVVMISDSKQQSSFYMHNTDGDAEDLKTVTMV